MSVENRLITAHLAKQESRIERGIIDAGNALFIINDEKLYRAGYRTFEEYVKDRWGFTRQRAYQLIEASGVIDSLSTIVDKSELPTNEAQIRELAKVPEDQRVGVLNKANSKAAKEGRKRTASDIKEAAKPESVEPELEYEEIEDEPEKESQPSQEEQMKAERKKARSYAEYLQRSIDDLNHIKRNLVVHPELIKLCGKILEGLDRW